MRKPKLLQAVLSVFLLCVLCTCFSLSKPLSFYKEGATRDRNELCVIVRYYSGQRDAFLSLLSSIYALESDVLIKIVITEPKVADYRKSVGDVVQAVTSLNRYFGPANTTRIELSSFNYHSSSTISYRAENQKCAENDYGYALTDMELDNLVKQDTCKYIMVTNGDNLYNSGLMKETRPMRQQGIDLIGFFFISRYPFPQKVPIRDSTSPNTLYRSRLNLGGIDLGACMFKSSVFRDNNLRFCKVKGNVHESDGNLIEQVAKDRMYKAEVLDQIMFMHQ
mmetsp:Transcript_29057/g.45808  ORF Transcript_29057/g.45808 Transcript_29057/m.45808 type:complete len:279 (+) Transcript_29057:65-901(+)